MLDDVKAARPDHAYRSVFLNFLMDYFDKAPSFDWFNDKEELQEALDYNLIRLDEDRKEVNWSERKMKKLHKAIENLVGFASGYEGEKYLQSLDDDIPIEPSNKAFWEYHLDL